MLQEINELSKYLPSPILGSDSLLSTSSESIAQTIHGKSGTTCPQLDSHKSIMNTETTWQPENVEENLEMIMSDDTAENQTGNTVEEEEYDVHDKLLGNSTAPLPPPTISKKKQRQLGPAPIASFEDISDEVRKKVCITPTHLWTIETVP